MDTGSAATVVSAMTTAMSSVAGDMMSILAASIPIALPVAGVVLSVSAGWRAFRKFTKG